MNQRRHVAVIAGLATLLASTAFTSVFDSLSWFPFVAFAVAAVVGASIGARALRAPVWVQPIAGAVALLLYVTVVFGRGGEILGVIPTPSTFASLRDQIDAAMRDIAALAAPVPVRRGLLLVTVLGLGATAIVVDLVAVGLRRAALAGLPLLGLYGVPVSIDRGGLSWLPFVLGAAGYLWLLGTEHVERVQRWGRPFRAATGVPMRVPDVGGALAMSGRRVAVAGIALAVLVPALLPGLTAEGWFGTAGSGGDIGPGGGRKVIAVNPVTTLRGNLVRGEPQELLRLRTNDSEPAYLRITTADRFTGSGWVPSQAEAGPSDRVREGLPPESFSEGVRVTKEDTRIEIRGLTGQRYLPVYANPTSIDVDGDWRWDRNTQSVFSSADTTADVDRYRFSSQRVNYTPRLLNAAPAVSPRETTYLRYTALPGGANPRIQDTVRQLTDGKTTQFARVIAIQNYFLPDNGFAYSLETKPGTDEDALVDFLYNDKRGYCEQYASAMAYMLRAGGIPARVAVGFGQGEKRNGYYSLTNYDAHAWVEVYFSGLGWVPFDPTPSAEGEGAGREGGLPWARNVTTADLGEGLDGTDVGADRPGEQPSAGAEDPAAQLDDQFDRQQAAAGRDGVAGVWDRVWDARGWVLGALVLVVVALVPSVLRVRVRRRRLRLTRAGDPVDGAHAAWDEVGDTLADLRIEVDDADTPRSLARRLGGDGLPEEGRRAVMLLGGAEERARYAARNTPVDGLAEAVETLREALLARAGRRRRFVARMFPASVLDRMAAAARTRAETAGLALADARAAVARRVLPTRMRRAG